MASTTASQASAPPGLSPEVLGLLARAQAGDSTAQFSLAAAYDYGTGAPRDGQEAMKWYRAAADQGNAEAQNSVGSGLQAEKKYSEALIWYEKAAGQGHALATNNLAYLYDLGLGVPQDRKRGQELYIRASDLGWAEAMWNLANAYGADSAGQPDLLMACVWTLRANKYMRPGDERLGAQLKRVLPQLPKHLSPEQMEKCKVEAEAWAPRSPSTS